MRDKLRAAGVETIAVVNTELERARLYARYRPTRVTLLADPDAVTHQAYRVPAFEVVDEAPAGAWPLKATLAQILAAAINPTGELPASVNPFEANGALNQKDGFQLTPVDEQIVATHGTQLAGHFLIDREGILRWVQVEARERIDDISRFPSETEFPAAVRTLTEAQARG
jgi:hypothetical protein